MTSPRPNYDPEARRAQAEALCAAALEAGRRQLSRCEPGTWQYELFQALIGIAPNQLEGVRDNYLRLHHETGEDDSDHLGYVEVLDRMIEYLGRVYTHVTDPKDFRRIALAMFVAIGLARVLSPAEIDPINDDIVEWLADEYAKFVPLRQPPIGQPRRT